MSAAAHPPPVVHIVDADAQATQSLRTVETHRASALRKLGLRNTPELARLLAQHDALRMRARSA